MHTLFIINEYTEEYTQKALSATSAR